jgi:hypothetical protein
MGDDGDRPDPIREARELMEKLAADPRHREIVERLKAFTADPRYREIAESAGRQIRESLAGFRGRSQFLASTAMPAIPAAAPAAKPAPPGPDPFRTGTAGRPSPAHIMLGEATRRIVVDKEITPTPRGLSAFARDLEKWWERKRLTYPEDLRPPELKTKQIAEIVRDLWRANITGPS